MRFSSVIFISIFFLAVFDSITIFAQCNQMQGSATALTGETKSYSYCYSSQTFVSPIWTITKGAVLSTSLSPDAMTAYATVRWDVQGTGTISLRDGVVLQTRNITISCSSIANPTFTPTSPSVCGSGSVTLVGSSGAGGNSVRYYSALTGGTLLKDGGSYTTPTISTTTSYYIVSYNTTSTCESSPRVQAAVAVNIIPSVPATTTPGSACKGSSATLGATPGANGTQVKWFDALTNGNLLGTGNSFTTPAINMPTTFYAATYNAAGTCSSTRTAVLASILSVPAYVQGGADADNIIYGAGTMTLTITPGVGGDNIRWYDSETGGTLVSQGVTFTTPYLTASRPYYVSTLNTSLNCESERVPVIFTVIATVSPSSIKQEMVRVAGIKLDNQLVALTPTQKTTQFSYFDGLMRAHQQVVQAASPAGNDIVQPVEFDSYGRPSKSYLPYVANAATGVYKAAFKTDQPAFYNNTSDKVADDTKPFAISRFERSPLGRTLEVGGVGNAFQPKIGQTGNTERIVYSYNTGSTNSEAEEVRLFKSDGTSSTFFGVNVLTRTEAKDADGNIQLIFADKAGRVLVKKQQLDEKINGVTVNYLQTYYIYDDFDRIKYIISPKGVAALRSGSWSSTTFTSILDQYVYQFVYDSRGRLIEKKVPGQAWMYYAYDKLNRLVLTQDGLLKASNKWMFIKYDAKGRAIMQGLYLNASQTTRATIQTLLDGLYVSTNPTCENRGTALHGYTNVSFPITNADGTNIEVQSVNYFESHDFDFNGSRDYKYDSITYAGQSTTSNWKARGLATGSKRLILGTTTWLYNYVYYDRYNRPIQVRSNNHLTAAIDNGTITVDNLTTNIYDFTKLLSSKTYHNAGGGKTTTIVNTYEYDPQDRLLKVYQKNNTDVNQLVVQYEYNELGQVVDKKLHNTTGTNFLQSVDYRYTIRGQLSSINNAALDVNAANNDETTDYFGMEFLYNTVDASNLSNAQYYNGNISAVKWKGVGATSGTTDQKSYKYKYDKSNKLDTATSQLYTGSAWTKEAGALNESMTYDHNGNIKSLQRNQRKHQLDGVIASYIFETIDDLTYTYSTTFGDQLLKVEDATANVSGFANGKSIATEYTYDVNGNTLIDENKGVSSIVYNFLGKPTQVNFTDGRKIDYIYDATGAKLTMKSYPATGTPITTTDYVGGFVYENAALSFFSSPEGRVVKNGSALEYQYSIADHQGNTRVVFSSAAPVVQTTSVTFEATSNSNVQNYPTGGNRSGWDLFNRTSPTPPNTYSHFLNGGNNSQVGVAKTYKVYPGDKVKIEAYAKYYNPQSTSVNLTTFATSLTGAFGLDASSTGEAAKAYQALNSYGGIVGAGNGPGNNTYPKLFVTILLFDKNHKFLDVAFDQIDGGLQTGVTPKAAHDYMMREYTVKEEGFAYAYISNENASYVEGYFDDVAFTYTPTNVVQYNEYYPFGLQASTSWTRDNSSNNFLYNAGNELNKTSGWYEMFFRGYDPSLGRMLQVDPMAAKYSSHTPYNYAFNDPVLWNDPSGADAWDDFWAKAHRLWEEVPADGGGSTWSEDGGFTGNYGNDVAGYVGMDYNNRHNSWSYTTPGSQEAFVRAYYDATGTRLLANANITIKGARYTGSPYSNPFWLNNRIDRTQGILAHSYDFWQTMSNPMVQSIYRGHQAFMDNPWGGGLMAFLTGGPMLGGGGSLLTSVGGRALMSAGARLGTKVLTNLTTTGLRSAAINAGMQAAIKGPGNIDLADVGISALGGDAWKTVGVLSGLIDISIDGNVQTALDKGLYQTGVDVGTGVFFGGANFAGSKYLVRVPSNSLGGVAVDATVQLYGEIFNWTLLQKP